MLPQYSFFVQDCLVRASGFAHTPVGRETNVAFQRRLFSLQSIVPRMVRSATVYAEKRCHSHWLPRGTNFPETGLRTNGLWNSSPTAESSGYEGTIGAVTARRNVGNTVDRRDPPRRSAQPECPAARGCYSSAQHTVEGKAHGPARLAGEKLSSKLRLLHEWAAQGISQSKRLRVAWCA